MAVARTSSSRWSASRSAASSIARCGCRCRLRFDPRRLLHLHRWRSRRRRTPWRGLRPTSGSRSRRLRPRDLLKGTDRCLGRLRARAVAAVVFGRAMTSWLSAKRGGREPRARVWRPFGGRAPICASVATSTPASRLRVMRDGKMLPPSRPPTSNLAAAVGARKATTSPPLPEIPKRRDRGAPAADRPAGCTSHRSSRARKTLTTPTSGNLR